MGKIGSNKTCLLVTGTIVPNSTFVAHTNVEQRITEYYEGLLFYANLLPGLPIFFLENSSYDLAGDPKLQRLFHEKKITLIKFPLSTHFNEGKGYQEFEMLDKAAEQLAGKFDSFIKITGRYRVLNLADLVDSPHKEFLADSHKKHRVTQTNVFYATFDFYNRYLKGLYAKVDDSKGTFIEKVVYDKLFDKDLSAKIELFPFNPLITGTSGSYGGTLNRNKVKMIVRNIERRILRLLGVKQFLIEY